MQSATPVARTEDEIRYNVRGAATRAKLLDAALVAFAARGFHGTSTRDIADAAGMSPAGVYAHYRTKEDLLFRLTLAGHSDALAVVSAAAGSTEDVIDRLRVVVRDFVVWHARFHTHARVVQYEMAALTPEHTAAIRELRHNIQACVREAIVAGVDAGAFTVADATSPARAIVSLGIDVARWYDAAGALSPEEIGDEYADLALRIVGVPRNAAG